MNATSALEIVGRLFQGYADGDLEAVRSLLADDLTAYVTNAESGVAEDTCYAALITSPVAFPGACSSTA
jgi:ketosteroid isomerase-like protein